MLKEELRIAVAKELGVDESIVNVMDVMKNNSVKKISLTVSEKRGNVTVSPRIYIEDILRDIENGYASVSEAAEHIAKKYRECKAFPIPNLEFTAETVMENAFMQVVNAEKNAELLDKVPNMKILDLAGVVRFEVTGVTSGHVGTILVTYDLCRKFGIDVSELLERAMENTKNAGFQIMGIGAMLGGLLGEEEEDDGAPGLCVVTNSEKMNGANAILFPELFGDYAKRMRGDFFVLPSSIHEILLLPTSGANASDLRMMVTEINATQVAPDEVLSNNVYLYKADTNELVVA